LYRYAKAGDIFTLHSLPGSAAAAAGLCTLNSVDPKLESAWLHPLNLKRDLLVSKFAFSNATCAATPW
jgi:hypothetical protein